MSLHELNKIVGRAAKALYDNEKFSVEVLAVRARKAAEAFPGDPTIVAMSSFLSKRAGAGVFITRAELKDVYHRLFSQNNKFGSLFSEELGTAEVSKPRTMLRDANEGKDFTKEAFDKLADPVLSNTLTAVFDKKASYKPYSASLAKTAERTCLHELNKFAAPRKIEVVAGQADLLICQATYETPKGNTHVLVPVEIREGTALLPTVFLCRAGFVDLTKEALEEHLVSTAGKTFTVDVQKLLEVVAAAKNGTVQPLSEMEMIIAKARAEKGTPSTHTVNGILYQEVDKPQLDVETPRLAEADDFATKLASPVGAAEFTFGRTVVDTGRKMLKQALGNFGFNDAKIAVADADSTTVFFAVSVDNKAGFKAPMKVVNSHIQFPKFVLSAGGMYDFSKTGISSILSNNDIDTKMMAAASPSYTLKASELIDQVRSAMEAGNLPLAEDALTVLQESGNQLAFKEAFTIYKDGLGGTIKTASEECRCTLQRKVAHSKYVICGHTNLPVHKVYQDKNGDCQPLYRKQIAEAESASFMHSKIYFG